MTRWVAALRLTGIGWYVAICIAGGVWFGLWLDGKLNSKPLLAIVGLGFGILLAFLGVYNILRSALYRSRGKEEE